MNARSGALAGTLALIGLLTYLTLAVAATDGITPLVVVSLVILALFAVGVVGALINPPEE